VFTTRYELNISMQLKLVVTRKGLKESNQAGISLLHPRADYEGRDNLQACIREIIYLHST